VETAQTAKRSSADPQGQSASLPEVAAALAALTGQPYPLATLPQLGPEGRAAQLVDRLPVPPLGVLAVGEQGPAARVDPLPQPVWATLVASDSQPRASAACQVCPVLLAASISPASDHMEERLRRLLGSLLRLGPRHLVAAEPVVQDGGYSM
jgi:hypothetical protein